ncbi:MAG TPA: RNA methyltransferase [Planctomycetaceae bacterium]|nr:RNA methyltransferase [Planctomycetaceae bacterium]
MPRIAIDSLDDPRVRPYCDLKASNLTRSELFIAEGTKLVARLIDSRYETASVLLSEKREAEWLPRIPDYIPVYIIPQELGSQLVGFSFHVGVVACGRRVPSPTIDVLPRDADRLTLVVCPNCDNPENLGAIIRISCGLGVDAILLGKGCSDPFSRRVLRVSMGTAFRMTIIESPDLGDDLDRLHLDWHVEFAATLLDPTATPLHQAQRSPRFGLLFGNEHAGLGPEWTARCQQRLTIPMHGDTDSLNVAIAAGIFLHHFTRGPE